MLVLTALAFLAQEEPDQTVTTAPRPIHGEPWITDRDYPPEAGRNRVRATVRIALQVGEEGEVTGCRIIRSGGTRLLDRETCRLVSKRARFTPAIGPAGSFTAEYQTTIHWPPRARR